MSYNEFEMLNQKIIQLKDKLNKSIVQQDQYSKTYYISTSLDKLITQYYKEYYYKKYN
ncbi:Spo0E family sporulation regulatory protein-aspartic acid phosphatase [Abyssisolibacter fermentans]|uniref:Spo0E family sporulation regulatory protein-aspartic acid phosphatase n=1 Tax=Abyssisolibacter fermentans TaxID=1766203 RepID=UPI0009EB9DE3|nr:Spo0E family sporulation regulatory protein-aspartic acid phosphatase [Abyssisolibacter fermentans]